jgi:Ca-activated chloride channel family protein
MFELAHPWLLLLLPLPFLVNWLVPPYREQKEAVRAPFFRELSSQAGLEPTTGAVVLQRNLWQKLLRPLVWVLLVMAAARPQWIDDPITQIESARDLMLAVDLSGSMETRDFTDPEGNQVDRLTAVRLVLEDFVTRRETDRLGLVLFGNAAFLQVPFTLDHQVFLQLLDEAQIGMAGPQTMLGDAIGLGIKAFEASEADQKVLILLTDGNDTGSRVPPPKAAEIAAQNDIKIHTIGVGDPASTGEAPLDEQTLRQIAQVTGGQFFRANDLTELEGVYQQLDELEPLEFETYSYRPKHELYHWLLAAVLVMVLLNHMIMALWSTVKARRAGSAVGAIEAPTMEARAR